MTKKTHKVTIKRDDVTVKRRTHTTHFERETPAISKGKKNTKVVTCKRGGVTKMSQKHAPYKQKTTWSFSGTKRADFPYVLN